MDEQEEEEGEAQVGEQTCPLLQPVASGNLSNNEHVLGTP